MIQQDPHRGVRVLSSAVRNDTEQRLCLAKRPIDSLSEAAEIAKTMHKKYKAGFIAYECSFCGRFHVARKKSRRAGELRSLRRGVHESNIFS